MFLLKKLKEKAKVANKKERIRDRLMVEYFLIRLWFENKEQGCFTFEPINIGTGNNPHFVDAIIYDMAPMSEQSLAVFVSTATNDRLLLRNTTSQEFHPVCIYRTVELLRLVIGLETQQKNDHV